jgi:hypothetical protein
MATFGTGSEYGAFPPQSLYDELAVRTQAPVAQGSHEYDAPSEAGDTESHVPSVFHESIGISEGMDAMDGSVAYEGSSLAPSESVTYAMLEPQRPSSKPSLTIRRVTSIYDPKDQDV